MISRTTFRQLVVFGLVGVVATITHYLVALGCHEGLGISLYVANLAGYSSAVTVSYFGHGKFTFQAVLNRSVLQRFLVVSVSTFFASEGLLAVLQAGLNLPHRVSLAVVVLTIPVVTFLLNKLWVYQVTHAGHTIEPAQSAGRTNE